MNGIVHTAEFFIYFYDFEIKHIEDTYSNYITYKDTKKFTINFENINMTISRKSGYTGMKIDFIKLIAKPSLGSADLTKIYEKIYDVIEPLLTYSKFPILKRWDFRLDVKFNSSFEKDLVYKLYNKTTTKLYKLNKQIYINESNCTNNYNFYYKSNALNSSITLNIYDKNNERVDKNLNPETYEEDIIRYEVQLRKKHIDYNKYQKDYKRELDTYLSEDIFIYYMEKYIKPIVFWGDYYDIYNARKIINLKVARKDEREKLINFLKLVSNTNIDKAKELYSPHAYKHCIKVLDELGINPILIPKNYRVKKIINPLNEIYKVFKK